MSDQEIESNPPADIPQEEVDEVIDSFLKDPATKLRFLRRLGLGTDPGSPVQEDGGTDVGLCAPNSILSRSTLCGKSTSVVQGSVVSLPTTNVQERGLCRSSQDSSSRLPQKRLADGLGKERHRRDVGPSQLEQNSEGTNGDSEDELVLLGEKEALEFVEFDPSVNTKGSWEPPPAMNVFLVKHFNRSLTEDEREAIMRDFPRPLCDALATPKIDEELKEQMRSHGKDPHFGAEKSLYKVQDQVLDVAGPLACLWHDLLNPNASPSTEDILLLIQRALYFWVVHPKPSVLRDVESRGLESIPS